MNRAFGFVEVIGMASAVVAVDTALKAANVTLEGLEPAKGQGMHTLKLAGNVGAVNAAVSSILGSPQLLGKVWSHTVIARPSQGLGLMIHGHDDVMEKETLAVKEVYEEKREDSEDEKQDTEESEKKDEDESEEKEDNIPVDNYVEETDDAENDEEDSKENSEEPVDSTNEKQEDNEEEMDEEKTSIDEPSPSEPLKETALKHKSSDGEGDLLEDKQYTCNLCKDEKCPRIKGEPRVKCIHYNEKE